MTKKLSNILFILCALFLISVSFSFAQPVVSISSVAGDPGQFVYPEITVENTESICAFEVQIDFPEAIVDTIWAERLGRLLDYNGYFVAQINQSTGNYHIFFTGFPPTSLPPGTEPIIRLHIELNDDAAYGDYPLDIVGMPIIRICPAQSTDSIVYDGMITVQTPGDFPEIDLSATSHNFGPVLIGETAEWQLVIRNLGVNALEVSQVVSSDPAFLISSPTFPQSIPGADSVVVDVVFAPTTAGTQTGMLTITSNDYDEGTRTVQVSGVGVTPYPDIQLSFTSYQFGSVIAGNSSSRLLTIYNVGDVPLVIDSIVSDNPNVFFVQDASLPMTIPTAGQETILIVFSPPAVDFYQGHITISSNDPDESDVVVTVEGQGVAESAQMSLTATQHNFGGVPVGDSATWNLRIFSIGNIPLIISDMTMTNAVFSIPAQTYPITINVGSFIQIPVEFSPDTPGFQTGQLQITSNDGTATVRTVDFTGTGLQQDIQVDPTQHDYGVVDVGDFSDWQLVIQNTGGSALQITNMSSDENAFTVESPGTFPQTINANSQLNATIRFTPTFNGLVQGELTIESDDPDEGTVTITLIGTGFQPAPVFNILETSHDFGTVNTDMTADWQFEVWNSGSADLVINDTDSSLPTVFSIVSPALPVTIPPQGSPVTFTARFNPQNAQTYQGTISLYHNDLANNPQTLTLSGEGVLPPSGLTLYMQSTTSTAGAEAVPVRITMVNQQVIESLTLTIHVPDDDLTVAQIMRTGVGNFFGIFNTTDLGNGYYDIELNGGTISPDSSYILRLDIDVDATSLGGTFPLEITEASGMGSSGQAVDAQVSNGTFTVSGTPEIDPSLQVFDFGDISINTTTQMTFQVRNPGTLGLNLASATFPAGSPFSVLSPSFPHVVGVADSQAVMVQFAPTQAGPVVHNLTIASNDPDEPNVAISFAGTGITPLPDINLSETTLDFGSVPIGDDNTADLVIENLGQGDLIIDSFSIDNNEFEVVSPIFPQTVPAGQDVVINLRFLPQTIGATDATLTLNHNDSDENPTTVALQGVGLQEDIDIVAGCDVGDVPLGQNGTCEFEICNTGNVNLLISGINSNNSQFVVTYPSFPRTVIPQDCIQVQVRFTPNAPGEAVGTLTVNSSDPDESAVPVTVSGMGIASEIEVDPSTIDFGMAEIGELIQRTLTVRNIGTDDLSIFGATPQQDEGTFTLNVSPSPPQTVVAGDSVVFTLNFRAFSQGAISGSLNLISDAYNESQTIVGLTATGFDCAAQLSATSHNFGSVSVGDEESWDLVVTNTCVNEPLSITDITFGLDDYSVEPSTFPVTIQPGNNETLSVTFSPQDVGARNTTMILMTSLTDPANYTVALSGQGIAPDVSPDDVSHDFGTVGVGETDTFVFFLSNSGTEAAHIEIDADFESTAFTVESPGFPLTIAPDETEEVTLVFAPEAEMSYSDSLILSTNDFMNPTITVSVTGEGITLDPDIHVNPNSLSHNFGQVEPGETESWSFIARNLGDGALTLDSLTFNMDEFSYSIFPNVTNLSPGDSVQITVHFQPNLETPPTVADTLQIWSNDPDESPFAILLLADVVSIEDENGVTNWQFSLYQNHPNPFSERTTIGFDLPRAGTVRIEIFNTAGQLIRVLRNQHFQQGHHEVIWDGTNAKERPVPSGIYFYRISTPEQTLSRKMSILMR